MRIKKKVQEASHVGDTDTAPGRIGTFNFPKEKNGVIMATKQKEVTTFDVQVAEFIRNHKQKGTATDDEINASLVIPLPWTLMELKIFCNEFRMQGFQSQITKEIQVRVFLVQKKSQNLAMRT